MLPKYLPLEYCLKIKNLEKYYNLQLESMEDTFIANGLAVESWDGNQEPTEYYWKKSTGKGRLAFRVRNAKPLSGRANNTKIGKALIFRAVFLEAVERTGP